MTPAPDETSEPLSLDELREAWLVLSKEDRFLGFRMLPRVDAEEFFLGLSAADQAWVLLRIPPSERRSWVRMLPPDDVADMIQEAPHEERDGLLGLLDDPTRKEVSSLLAYAEDQAGGLMNPRYSRVRPDMTVDEAVSYLRRQARDHRDTLHQATTQYVYVLDDKQHLRGVVSFYELFAAPGDKRVREVMQTDIVKVDENQDQEAVSLLFASSGLTAIPVVDGEGHMKGIVTVDDIVEVVQEEATEDIQKIGGMEALDAPYFRVGFFHMVRKRAGWLLALFLSEMLTTTAMDHFQGKIEVVPLLAVFVPLIMSSGGNSGSQATTLIIRAMALGEVRLRDWWRVIARESAAGLALGWILGSVAIGLNIFRHYAHLMNFGIHFVVFALTIACSLVGVVLFGTVVGSMLPFVLRRLGFDPASASAPFVATLVDVTGLIIYFTVASVILRGTLL